MSVDLPLLGDHFDDIADELRRFQWNGKATLVQEAIVTPAAGSSARIPVFLNEFWTSRQRAAHSLHEISYRACFKPQLPRFFIERLTRPGDVVHDPFMGRGTTPIEAALLGRVPSGSDLNPLSTILVEPRLTPPTAAAIAARFGIIDLHDHDAIPDDLLVFYHPDTLREICALRKYLRARAEGCDLDATDRWIRMVAVNRLTGHSPGFFSVYTLPPNQAVSIDSQRKINLQRSQTPPRRSVPDLVLAKSRTLLADCDSGTVAALARVNKRAQFFTASAEASPGLQDDSVDLVVTSPPFLDVVNYAGDNWLRCWFCGIDSAGITLTVLKRLEEWEAAMTRVFQEMRRVLRPGGHVAFEVGEVRAGTVRLEESVVRCASAAGLEPVLILINSQRFTKTANCWGVSNNSKGTNSNRIVLLRKR
jgi:hypothetical protein